MKLWGNVRRPAEGSSRWRGLALAMIAGGVALWALQLAGALNPPKLPVATESLAPGTALTAATWHWVAVNDLKAHGPWSQGGRGRWYAARSLVEGSVLSAADVTTQPPSGPSGAMGVPIAYSGPQAGQLRPGAEVVVMVVSKAGILWQSAPVTVLAASASGLMGSPGAQLLVRMSAPEAQHFEASAQSGSVAVVLWNA